MSSSTASVLILGVRLYGEGDQVDVLISDGQIAKIGPDLVADLDLVDVIDAPGQVLLPGFVDLHTHLREPGREYTETIESGSAAAALGGFTAVFAMANTEPVADRRWSPTMSGTAGARSAWWTCTRWARSPSVLRASSSPRWA